MTAVSFIAKADANNACNVEQYGCEQFKVFASDWPYTLASFKHDVKPEVWTVYCMARADIGLGLVETTKFDTKAEAAGFIRQTYETALSVYHAKCAEVFAVLYQGLSPVQVVDAKYVELTEGKGESIAVRMIFNEGWSAIEMAMTVQEALTALDYGFERAGMVASIVGRKIPGSNHGGWVGWTIPAMSKDYHLAGYRSLTGKGRG